MTDLRVDLARRSLPPDLGDLIREARLLVGGSQRQLAAAAGTSQPTISRIERGQATVLDLAVVARVLEALGMRATLHVDARHLADRRRQRDAVHAWVNGYLARRLDRLGWLTGTEARIGREAPRGWIDLVAYRPADRSMFIDETKTDLPDVGGLQRSLSFYERAAWDVARERGWAPRRIVVAAIMLDSEAIAGRVAANRDLLRNAFPGDVAALSAWLRDASQVPPRGWTQPRAPRRRGENTGSARRQ